MTSLITRSVAAFLSSSLFLASCVQSHQLPQNNSAVDSRWGEALVNTVHWGSGALVFSLAGMAVTQTATIEQMHINTEDAWREVARGPAVERVSSSELQESLENHPLIAGPGNDLKVEFGKTQDGRVQVTATNLETKESTQTTLPNERGRVENLRTPSGDVLHESLEVSASGADVDAFFDSPADILVLQKGVLKDGFLTPKRTSQWDRVPQWEGIPSADQSPQALELPQRAGIRYVIYLQKITDEAGKPGFSVFFVGDYPGVPESLADDSFGRLSLPDGLNFKPDVKANITGYVKWALGAQSGLKPADADVIVPLTTPFIETVQQQDPSANPHWSQKAYEYENQVAARFERSQRAQDAEDGHIATVLALILSTAVFTPITATRVGQFFLNSKGPKKAED